MRNNSFGKTCTIKFNTEISYVSVENLWVGKKLRSIYNIQIHKNKINYTLTTIKKIKIYILNYIYFEILHIQLLF